MLHENGKGGDNEGGLLETDISKFSRRCLQLSVSGLFIKFEVFHQD